MLAKRFVCIKNNDENVIADTGVTNDETRSFIVA